MEAKIKKWPKQLPSLSQEKEFISHDFMQYWHEILAHSSRYRVIETFNHGYILKHTPKNFLTTLEIGAGLGEHLHHEILTPKQSQHYVALELRQNMAEKLKAAFPKVQVQIADCQEPLSFADHHFDRILAIHVLEHLPNLPATIREMYRVCHKQQGHVLIIIPCEGGLFYSFARKISAQRLFEKRYKQSYQWLIEREHINRPHEILEELQPYFSIEHRTFFPLKLPSIHLNLCIGLTLRPK